MYVGLSSSRRPPRRLILGALAPLAFALALAAPATASIKIDAAYPGGNVIVEKIERNVAYVRPDLRDIKKGGWWFYWNFRVTGAAGQKLTFRFTDKNPIGTRGPALSRDGGASWSWMGLAAVRTLKTQDSSAGILPAAGMQAGSLRYNAWEFDYTFADDREVRFSYCIPYLQSDLERFLARHQGDPALEKGELCKSRKGRSVECLRLGKLNGEPKYRVLLASRHHACESMGDYVMEGILEAALEDSPEGRAWREQVEIMAVPFMDKDGIEDGDQGKNRAPHDHNRDYDEGSLYPEVRAIKARAPQWAGGKLAVALDLHCPYIRGENNEHVYFVGMSDPKIWEETGKLARILEATRTGPIPYAAKGNLPYGTAWNKPTNFEGKSFGAWSRELPGIRVGGSIETPYATASGAEVTADSARALGKDLARAILKYLNEQ